MNYPSVSSNPVHDFSPGYDSNPGGRERVSVDPDGQQKVRGPVLTDEGGYRLNFSGTSLAKSIGTATFTTGSDEATWINDAAYDLHRGDYVYLTADGASVAAQVDTFDDTTIYLVTAYTGTGGTGASSRQVMKSITGTGTAVAVASGVCTMTTGTTSGSVVELQRDVDVLPLNRQAGVTVSQRIANQSVIVGLIENAATPRWFARFVLEGTVNTVLKTQTARNATGAPSASETEEFTVTIPNGKTTAVSLRYRVEMFVDRVLFYIDGILVATHVKSLPNPADTMVSVVRATNTGTAASTTTVTVDYDVCRNFNSLDIYPASDLSPFAAQQPPLAPFIDTRAGVVTISTDLMIIDCSQFRSLLIQCTSMGTTGVVTPYWTNDLAVTGTAGSLVAPAGAAAGTFNAAGVWTTQVLARYLRLRMTTATTAGTTTLNVQGSQTVVGVYNSTTVDTELPTAAALADGAANATTPTVGAASLVFNGATWDRLRGNWNSTTGDTGAKVATGNGATQTNHNSRGAILTFVLGTVTGTNPTCVFKVQGSGDSGTTWFDIPGATTASLTATGNTVLAVFPGVTVAANAAVSYPLPRTWRVVWTIGGATPSFTITSVQVAYIN